MRISKLPGQKKFQSDLSTIKPRNLATDSGTFGKFTFVSVILPIDQFSYDEKYKKWWYYEFDLDGKFLLIFMKVDHDRKEDVKVAKLYIEELRNQKQQGFALAALNHEYEE